MKSVHFVAIRLILKNNTKIKGVVSIPEGHSDPKVSTLRIFQSDRIPSRTVDGLHYGFLIIGGNLSLAEQFPVLVDKGYLDNPILLGDFDAALPNHLLPIIQVVSLGGGQRRDPEDGHSLALVAEDQLGRFHTLNINLIMHKLQHKNAHLFRLDERG